MKNGSIRKDTSAGGSSFAWDQLRSIAGMDNLEAALAALEHLDASNLQMRWRELFGRNAPARFGPDLLRRAIAYQLQEQALGGLSRQAQLRLKAAGSRSGKCNTRGDQPSPAIIKPGTRFVREWQNEVHEVQAIDTGDFVYRGKTFRSLTLIAREITGTHQSGPRFFGIRKKDSAAGKLEVLHG